MTERRSKTGKLARARAIDRHCMLPGAAQHRYLLNPCLTESEVRQFESRHGVELPADYREFVLTVGDGGAGPDYGVSRLAGCSVRGTLRSPFRFSVAANPYEESECCESDADHPDGQATNPYYDGCMLIGGVGCGVWNMLVVTGELRGLIWQDFSVEDRGFIPTGRAFLQWYEAWLDGILSEVGLGERLEAQWKAQTCLGFPRQCPKCFGLNVRTTSIAPTANQWIVTVTSASEAETSGRECHTCLDCGYSVTSYAMPRMFRQ